MDGSEFERVAFIKVKQMRDRNRTMVRSICLCWRANEFSEIGNARPTIWIRVALGFAVIGLELFSLGGVMAGTPGSSLTASIRRRLLPISRRGLAIFPTPLDF